MKRGSDSKPNARENTSPRKRKVLSLVVLLGNVAIKMLTELSWDGENLCVTNCPEANELLTKKYRPGWQVL